MKFDHTNGYFYIFVGESFEVQFDFTNSMATGESLSSCVVLMTDELGNDVTSTMVSGQSTVSPSHYFVVGNTVAGETYNIKLTGTSSGSKLYVGYLTVESFASTTLNSNLGDPNANSYVTLKEANNYVKNVRGHSNVWDTLSNEGKERLLIEATRDIDRLNFRGSKYYDFQSLEFPRDDHEKITGNVATPITINSFKNTSFVSNTYGNRKSNSNYWKYGTIHITSATPLHDVRAISTSNISTSVVTTFTNFSATPTTNTKFIAFEPLQKEIKNAQCEQALYILDNTNSDDLVAYGMISNEVEIGDVRVKFKDNISDKKQGHSPSAKGLLSRWTTKIIKVYRS